MQKEAEPDMLSERQKELYRKMRGNIEPREMQEHAMLNGYLWAERAEKAGRAQNKDAIVGYKVFNSFTDICSAGYSVTSVKRAITEKKEHKSLMWKRLSVEKVKKIA